MSKFCYSDLLIDFTSQLFNFFGFSGSISFVILTYSLTLLHSFLISLDSVDL